MALRPLRGTKLLTRLGICSHTASENKNITCATYGQAAHKENDKKSNSSILQNLACRGSAGLLQAASAIWHNAAVTMLAPVSSEFTVVVPAGSKTLAEAIVYHDALGEKS